jgi:hypothetical protein
MTAAMLVGRVVLHGRGRRSRLRHLAKQVAGVAAQVEAKSGDVRKASTKAKLAAQILT